MKILLPDDQMDSGSGMASELQKIFPDTEFINYSEEKSVAEKVKFNPDIIFLNLHLQNSVSIEICRDIKNSTLTSHIPVVFLVKRDNVPANLNEALQAGADSFLRQPVEKTELETTVKLLLRLRKSDNEIRYGKVFRSSPVPGFIWGFEGNTFTLVDVNDAAEKLTEGKAGDSIGMNAEEMYSGRRDIVERMEFCLKKRRKVVYETDYFSRGIQVVQKIIFTYVSENLILLHMEDITEYIKTQQEVQESEKKFRSLISEMDQGLALHEPIFNEKGKMIDFRFVEINKSFEKQTGLKGQDIRGKTLKEVLPGSEEEWIQVYEQVVKNGKITHFEKYSKELNRYYEVVAYRNRKNQFATVVTDITERKNYLKELNLHNERLEALTKILKHDFKNSADLLQFTLGQAIKLTESRNGFLFFYDEQTQKFSLQAWSEGLKKECTVNEERLEYELKNTGYWSESVRQRKPFIINNYAEDNPYKRGLPGGHIDMKRFLTVPVIAEDQIKAVVGVSNKDFDYTETDVRQVTLLLDTLWKVVERNQHNEKLMKAKEKAEESDRLKSAFLANLSHEIRTPMNGILGFAEMLKGAAIPDTTKEEYLEIIDKSGSRMLNILNDLMAISRIESNQVEINYTRLNLNEQIDSLVKKFETEAASKGIQLIHHKAFSYEDAFIVTDKEKLYVVLFNLINNAIKYTNEGSVEFGYELNGKYLQFKVKDTGIGIDPDCLDIIFDRFVQADNSLSKPYEGAGLGLSIARAYAELLGGNIRVSSEKGKGSAFVFELPFKKEDRINEPSAEKKNPIVPSEDEVLKNLTVLVAEDDEVVRIYLEQLLEGKCKKVFYAQNGKEAVGIYSRNPGIDLILMDIKMPVMDGYSATIRIRAIDHNAKIVAQTAYALSGDREKAIAAGCDDYVTKPLSKQTLISTIQKLFVNSAV